MRTVTLRMSEVVPKTRFDESSPEDLLCIISWSPDNTQVGVMFTSALPQAIVDIGGRGSPYATFADCELVTFLSLIRDCVDAYRAEKLSSAAVSFIVYRVNEIYSARLRRILERVKCTTPA